MQAVRKLAAISLLAIILISCGGGEELAGKWNLVDPGTGAGLGDVLTLSEDGTWSRSGTPSYSGTYLSESGVLTLKIEAYNGKSREEMISEAVKVGQPREQAEQSLQRFEDSQIFELVSDDGVQLLKQLDPQDGSPQHVFKKSVAN